ncbi:hypothetical protein LXJ58_30930, partial [Escherichia coli]|nr:hypothetical protein [Escherichia coli]
MANTYTKAAFTLTMSHADAALLTIAEQAVDILDTNGDDADLAHEYDALDPAFHAVFPAKGPMKFESFLEIFDDWHFPYLDCAIDIDWKGEDGNARVFFSGDQF